MMNWEALSKAVSFYKSHGFRYIDVPWVTTQEMMNVTKPDEKAKDRSFILENGLEMIASAEQGFITLLHENLLPKGRFVSCSPCFRGEPEYNAIHHPYFMKVELYSSDASAHELDYIIRTAERWFKQFGVTTSRVDINHSQIDLEAKGIELGSYGFRSYNNQDFVYGTGHAEPRTSYVKNLASL